MFKFSELNSAEGYDLWDSIPSDRESEAEDISDDE